MAQEPPYVPAWKLEQVVSDWQRRRAEILADAQFHDDEALLAQAMTGPTDDVDRLLNDLIEGAVWAGVREAEQRAVSGAVASRAERYSQRRSILRSTIMRVMEATSKRFFRSPWGTASLREGRVPVVISDPAALPDTLVTTEVVRTPDLAAIRAMLETGATVPGAMWGNPEPVLTIRPPSSSSTSPSGASTLPSTSSSPDQDS